MHTTAVPLLGREALDGRTLDVPLLAKGDDERPIADNAHADHGIILAQLDGPDPDRRQAHGPHFLLRETDGLALPRHQQNLVLPSSFGHPAQLVAFLHAHGRHRAPTGSRRKVLQRDSLDPPALGDHGQIGRGQLLFLWRVRKDQRARQLLRACQGRQIADRYILFIGQLVKRSHDRLTTDREKGQVITGIAPHLGQWHCL